jgi:hypothetical protein
MIIVGVAQKKVYIANNTLHSHILPLRLWVRGSSNHGRGLIKSRCHNLDTRKASFDGGFVVDGLCTYKDNQH